MPLLALPPNWGRALRPAVQQAPQQQLELRWRRQQPWHPLPPLQQQLVPLLLQQVQLLQQGKQALRQEPLQLEWAPLPPLLPTHQQEGRQWGGRSRPRRR